MFPVAVAFLTPALAVPQRYRDAFISAVDAIAAGQSAPAPAPYPSGCSDGPHPGPCGGVARTSPGRRRAEVLATADVALCTNVHAYVREHHLDKLINALVNGATDTAEGAVSSSVAEWCASNAASFNDDDDDSRRRVETEWDAYEAMLGLDLGAQAKDPEHGSEEYLAKVHEIANESRRLARLRRLSQETEEDVELPAEMWQQCAGYAFAINKMVTTIDGTGSFAAAIFAMSTSGGPTENMNACGAVVNSVNDALENGVLEGMHKQEDGSVMIAASHPDALQFEQLGLKTISFAIGGVVQAGYMIMKICTSYQSQIAIV